MSKIKQCRPISPIRGWIIVEAECVDADDECEPLKHPYTHDLPLYRCDEPDGKVAAWRVFNRKLDAELYIKEKLRCEDYRVVPVVVRDDKRRSRPQPEKEENR